MQPRSVSKSGTLHTIQLRFRNTLILAITQRRTESAVQKVQEQLPIPSKKKCKSGVLEESPKLQPLNTILTLTLTLNRQMSVLGRPELRLQTLMSSSQQWSCRQNSTVICLRQLVLQFWCWGVGDGVGVKMAEWMVKGYSQHKWYEAVQELLLKQMEQRVGLVHNVEEVDFRFRLWLRNGYACQQIIHSQ